MTETLFLPELVPISANTNPSICCSGLLPSFGGSRHRFEGAYSVKMESEVIASKATSDLMVFLYCGCTL